MKLKKIAAAILAAGVLAISAPSLGAGMGANIASAEDYSDFLVENDFEYSLSADGSSATIAGYVGNEANIVIPDTLGGAPVKSIHHDAFYTHYQLESVKLPESLEYIGPHAFEGTRIKSIDVPKNVSDLSGAFNFCVDLEEINVSAENPFYLSEDGVLYNRDKTVLVCYPDGKNETSFTVPDSVEEIDYFRDGFRGALEEINVSEKNNYYSSVDGILFNKDKTKLEVYPSAKTDTKYIIPDTVKELSMYAFINCFYLENVVIPDGVTQIPYGAFFTCQRLRTVTIPKTVERIDSAFGWCEFISDVRFGGTTDEWNKLKTANEGNEYNYPLFYSKVTCSDGDVAATPYEYLVNKDGKTITITHYHGDFAEIEIPSTIDGMPVSSLGEYITEIGEYSMSAMDYATFMNRPNLKKVTIPDTVTTIGAQCFDGCTELSDVIIPNSVTSIGGYAFNDCSSLESINLPKNLTGIAGCTFMRSGLKNIEIPDGVTGFGQNAFAFCENLESVTIPKSVTFVNFAAFNECTAVETVNYAGTMAEWENIEIRKNNDCLLRAKIICTDGTIVDGEPESSSPSSSSTSSSTTETSEPETSVPAPNEEDFHPENEVSGTVEESPDAKDIPDDDRIKTITINPAFNMKNKNGDNVELDLSKVSIKASEIYDEEGLKRAEEALGQTIKGNKHYNLLDLTLLYDGEDFSNGYEGLVKVVIPLPKGHRDKVFSCYRLVEVNGKMEKQEIPGTQTEDSYVIYLEHFSLYALVADDAPADTADETTDETTTVPADTTKNPQTGAAVALIPTALAAGAVLAVSRKRK